VDGHENLKANSPGAGGSFTSLTTTLPSFEAFKESIVSGSLSMIYARRKTKGFDIEGKLQRDRQLYEWCVCSKIYVHVTVA
jgi:hypothetical protein